MSQNVHLPKNVDISNLSFSQMNILKNGGKSVFINLNKGPLIIQTPNMVTPFGLSKYQHDTEVSKSEIEKWTLQLSLRDIETNPAMSNFYKFLKDLDSSVLTECTTNSKLWFKKQYTEDILRELCSPLIIYPKDKNTGEITDKYAPMFRLSVPMIGGQIACDCYDTNKNKIDLATVEKGSKVRAIIQCSGIWFIGSKFGLSWKVIQLQVQPQTSISGFAFMNDDCDNEDENPKREFIQTSDDEEDPLDKGITNAYEESNVEPEPVEEQEQEQEQPSAPEKKSRGKKK